jgi:hypothetical protein
MEPVKRLDTPLVGIDRDEILHPVFCGSFGDLIGCISMEVNE